MRDRISLALEAGQEAVDYAEAEEIAAREDVDSIEEDVGDIDPDVVSGLESRELDALYEHQDSIGDAVIALEQVFHSLHDSLQHGGMSCEDLTVTVESVSTALYLTDSDGIQVSTEGHKTDLANTELTLESMWDSVKRGYQKIVEMLASLWTRFSTWLKGLFSSSKKSQQTAEAQEEKIDAAVKDTGKAKQDVPESIEISTQLAAFLDFSHTSSSDVKGYLRSCERILTDSSHTLIPEARETLRNITDDIKHGVDSDNHAFKVPKDVFEKLGDHWKLVSTSKDSATGLPVEIYNSEPRPGGYVFELRLAVVNKSDIENKMKQDPATALKLIANSTLRLKPDMRGVKTNSTIKVESLQDLKNISSTVSTFAGTLSKVGDQVSKMMSDGEKAIENVRGQIRLLDRTPFGKSRVAVITAAMNMLRRYMTSLVAHERVYQAYYLTCTNAYNTYIQQQMKAHGISVTEESDK